ncbi:8-oxo-dGTP diphosphatase [Chlamydia abortus]|uniref:NUDIX domain-containing protein n=1 Tax=Paenibacillus residui TaxID=629724 RepID=A0ABW3D652_9BACL|nr:8-oxo-dGTP diphosphatase [Paenibacillus sp. 32O-W]SHE13634.1 8-oxo-dGTP diphosphatase [Chlamydia abortus]
MKLENEIAADGVDPLLLKYTICYIRHNDSLLLLNRKSPPVMGLWHGVGGKIEAGESPADSVLREVLEETGIHLDHVRDRGKVTWTTLGGTSGGMYAFLADFPGHLDPQAYITPRETDEGILDWKPIGWVLDPQNNGIPQHARYYLPQLLEDGPSAYEYCCTFKDGNLIDYSAVPLIAQWTASSRE